jgi:hypothetical protein
MIEETSEKYHKIFESGDRLQEVQLVPKKKYKKIIAEILLSFLSYLFYVVFFSN